MPGAELMPHPGHGECIVVDFAYVAQNIVCRDANDNCSPASDPNGGLKPGDSGECIIIDMEWLSENIICGNTPPGTGHDGLFNNDGCISVLLCDSLEFGNNGCVQIDMEWLSENIICGDTPPGVGNDGLINKDWLYKCEHM